MFLQSQLKDKDEEINRVTGVTGELVEKDKKTTTARKVSQWCATESATVIMIIIGEMYWHTDWETKQQQQENLGNTAFPVLWFH